MKLGEGVIGTAANNYAAKYSLALLKGLYNKYQRRGAEVDLELREAFTEKIDGVKLLSDSQKQLVEKCLRLEAGFNTPNGYEITKLKSASPFVDMSMKMNTTALSHPVATGKVSAIIDTSPADYLASIWDHCGSTKMRIHREEGHVARLVVNTVGPNEKIVATIKIFTKPLSNREFVVRLIWWMVNADTYLLALVDCGDLAVDYGSNLSVVRGKTFGLHIVKSFGEIGVDGLARQCQVTSYQSLDGGGYLPQNIVDSKMPKTLNFLTSARDLFNRDKEIDQEANDALVAIMRGGRETYEPDEAAIINDSIEKFGRLETDDLLKAIDSPDSLVIMFAGFISGQKHIVGRAITEVDASMEECCAWDYLSMSRERTNKFYTGIGRQRRMKIKNHHCQTSHSVYDLTGVSSIYLRELLTNTVWKRNVSGNKMTTAYVSVTDNDFAPATDTFVRMLGSTLVYYERLSSVGSIQRTRVEFYSQVNLGGFIPIEFVNSRIKGFLSHVSEMRSKFDKSLEIDSSSRDAIVLKMQEDQEYTTEEEIQIKNGSDRLTEFDALANKKTVESASPLAKFETAQKVGERNAYGKASGIIRASPEQIIAYQMDFMSRLSQTAETINKRVISENAHSKLVYMEKVIPKPWVNRDFLMRLLWKKLGDTNKNYVFAITPEIHHEYPANEGGLVRAEAPITIKLNALHEDETAVEYLIQLDIGGGDHSGLVTCIMNLYLHKNLENLTIMQEYFQQLRPLDKLDEQDGVAMGEAFVLKYSKKEKADAKASKHSKAYTRVQAVISSHKALKQYGGQNPWFGDLMTGVVSNKLLGSSGAVSSRVLTLSNKEGRMIGNSLASIMMDFVGFSG